MISFSLTCWVLALLFFIAGRRINRKARLIVTFSLASAPPLLLVFLMLAGDKAPTNTATIYQGPAMAVKYEQNKEYQELFDEGVRLAANGRHEEAIQVLEKASRINRVALPSYYVMLEVAKSEYAMKDREKCKKALNDFLNSAEIELSPARDNAYFIILGNSEARLTQLKSDVIQAKALLEKCQ